MDATKLQQYRKQLLTVVPSNIIGLMSFLADYSVRHQCLIMKNLLHHRRSTLIIHEDGAQTFIVSPEPGAIEFWWRVTPAMAKALSDRRTERMKGHKEAA